MADITNRQASHPYGRACLRWVSAFALVVTCLICTPVWGRTLIIKRLTTIQFHHVYYLHVGMHVGLSPSAQHALQSGIPLLLKLRIRVVRRNAWFWQGPLATLSERFSIQDRVLTEQIVVRDLNSGSQSYFRNIHAALRALDSVQDIPIIDRSLLHTGHHYRIRVKAILDIEDIPSNLRWVAWIWSDWRTTSPWQTTSLNP
ncbi:hypothetical protein B1B_09954 [mine drainage metagenome]|uniref:DUF4390 domain-containing protein n=3 Tax=mine drainage metagenome TaxID=410659 RepID=T1BIH5_9ZZZZ